MVRGDRSVSMAAKQAALKAFGARLQEARAASGFTQEAVADALSVSTQTVRNWEAGRTEPSGRDKERLATLYGKSIEWFFEESIPSEIRTAARLKQARVEAGLTQRRAADLMGLDPNTIARYEGGRLQPSDDALHALADAYGRPVAWFLGSSEVSMADDDIISLDDLADDDPILQETELALRSMGNDLTPGDIKAIRDFIRFVHAQRKLENETEQGG